MILPNWTEQPSAAAWISRTGEKQLLSILAHACICSITGSVLKWWKHSLTCRPACACIAEKFNTLPDSQELSDLKSAGQLIKKTLDNVVIVGGVEGCCKPLHVFEIDAFKACKTVDLCSIYTWFCLLSAWKVHQPTKEKIEVVSSARFLVRPCTWLDDVATIMPNTTARQYKYTMPTPAL